MAKDAYYFPHDFHARHDLELQELIFKKNMAGVGIYWCLNEILHEEGGYVLLSKIPSISIGLLTKQEEIIDVIMNFKLFKNDGKKFWSTRVLRNLRERKAKYEVKAEAGRIGGLKSGLSRRTKQNEAVLQANEQKERKGKEKKRNKGDASQSQNLACADYLKPENIKNLKNLFKNDTAIKNHLLGMNFNEVDIDNALGKKF